MLLVNPAQKGTALTRPMFTRACGTCLSRLTFQVRVVPTSLPFLVVFLNAGIPTSHVSYPVFASAELLNADNL